MGQVNLSPIHAADPSIAYLPSRVLLLSRAAPSHAPTVLYLRAMLLMLTAVRPHALTPGSFAISITMILITGGVGASSRHHRSQSTIR